MSAFLTFLVVAAIGYGLWRLGQSASAGGGRQTGTWAIKFYPDRRAVAVKLEVSMSDPEQSAYAYARWVTFFVSHQLFYYGNGAQEHDTSGPLRELLRRAVSPTEPYSDWRLVEWDLFENPLFRYDGTMFPNAISVPTVLGVSPMEAKDASLTHAPAVLVARLAQGAITARNEGRITGNQGVIVPAAVRLLLEQHETQGPAASIADAAKRARAAWEKAFAAYKPAGV